MILWILFPSKESDFNNVMHVIITIILLPLQKIKLVYDETPRVNSLVNSSKTNINNNEMQPRYLLTNLIVFNQYNKIK